MSPPSSHLSSLSILLLSLPLTLCANPQHTGLFAITNIHLFDGHSLSPDLTSVTIQNGLISSLSPSSLPPSASLIDGHGGTLIPGLIDSHVHIAAPPDPTVAVLRLQELRAQGITTAFDLACRVGPDHTGCDALNFATSQSPSTSDPSNPSLPPYPSLFFSHLPATTVNSTHARLVGPQLSLNTHDDVDEFISARIAEPSRFVKIILSDPSPSLSIYAAKRIVDAVHKAGKLAVCHAARSKAFDVGLAVGCDQLHHLPSDVALNERQVNEIKRKGVLVVPTLVQMKGIAEGMKSWAGWGFRVMGAVKDGMSGEGWEWKAPPNYEASVESLKRLRKEGVEIAVGTDAVAKKMPVMGSVTFFDGFGIELELLEEAGVDVLDMLRAATEVPARRWGLTDRGVVEEGKRADLVLLGGKVDGAKALRDVRRVWIGGIEVEEGGKGNAEGRDEL